MQVGRVPLRNSEARESFPPTQWTTILQAGDAQAPALESFAAAYWRPIYSYFRRKWGKSHDEAKDLTQEFFAALAEKNFLGQLSPERGKARHYVMTVLDNFARMLHRSESSVKRGGAAARFSLDIDRDVEPASGDPDALFRREWAASVLDQALGDLEREPDSESEVRLFLLHEVEEPDLSYEGLADRFGLNVTQVRNALYRTRQRLRRLVMERLRVTVSTEEEALEEFRELFW